MKNLIAVITFAIGAHAYGLSYSFQPSVGQVSFTAKGKPSMIKIKGTGKGVQGKLTEKDKTLSGSLSFNLSTLDTEIALRDEHMKGKYLEVQKFPTAVLYLKELKIPESRTGTVDFKGEMEIKGIKKPVQGKVTLNPAGADKVKVQADFPIKISDYPSIGVPSYMGITVAEEVQVSVNSEAIQE